ncbi:MAG: hypothetical protein K2H35_05270 [Muribaculaceae bacterium]|nr:hypothetical protein [Muribaculaceae bacterium]
MVAGVNISRNKSMKAARSRAHDYKRKGFYLITATIYPGSPILSRVNIPAGMDLADVMRSREMLIPDNTPAGEGVRIQIRDLPKFHPLLKVVRYVIMPDHIHILIQVLDNLSHELGTELNGFFTACSRVASSAVGLSEVQTLFKPYDDVIIREYPQLDRAVKYIEDNPRRYLVKKHHPDLFKTYLHLQIECHEYAAYGNIFLLKEPWLMQVRIHRRWSEAEFAKYRSDRLKDIESGAIPVSPAIHKAEKEIMNEAIEMGRSVILLRDQGFEDRFKPQGKYFDLCAEGRLLLLAPWPENLERRSTAGYTQFHQMNDFAAAIASIPATARLSIRFPSAQR